MLDTVVNQIIKQEIQLLDKIEPLDVLAELIDNEFIEIGSSAVIYDKTEVIRWLASNDPSERIGTSFKAHPLAENIILLTYSPYARPLVSQSCFLKHASRSDLP